MSRDLYPAVLPEKGYQPKSWSSTHRYIVLLEIAGKKPGEIAQIVDMDISRVSVILNDPRAELDRISFSQKAVDTLIDVQSKLQIYAHEALEEVVDEMRHSQKEVIRQRASFGILDRAGYTPIRKEVVAAQELPSEVADRMREVADELKEYTRPTYEYVEAEIVEEELSGD